MVASTLKVGEVGAEDGPALGRSRAVPAGVASTLKAAGQRAVDGTSLGVGWRGSYRCSSTLGAGGWMCGDGTSPGGWRARRLPGSEDAGGGWVEVLRQSRPWGFGSAGDGAYA
ncbi:hypothetical protein GCM10009789_85150 [Kribbella sancticallisti]|uniref:Uncharacterized protein n=1 Tax=Kribbella sancticallisti TaxID=460087 RepID=A0ABP4QQ12_9ACTN